MTSSEQLTIGDAVPDVDLIDHSGNLWNPRQVQRTTVLIFHRHLA